MNPSNRIELPKCSAMARDREGSITKVRKSPKVAGFEVIVSDRFWVNAKV